MASVWYSAELGCFQCKSLGAMKVFILVYIVDLMSQDASSWGDYYGDSEIKAMVR